MNNVLHTKVFIADDHPVVIYGLTALLSKSPGCEVAGTASSGPEMRQALSEINADILFMDLNMPGGDFYENIAWVSAHKPRLKILAYSAYYSSDLVKSLLQSGVKGYLPKTAGAGEIFDAIEAIRKGENYIATVAQAHSGNCPDPENLHRSDDFRKRLGLSRREQEVLVLISRGMSSQSIGEKLFISKYTVETHRKNMLRKLDFNTSTELVKFAVVQGLV